MKIYLKQEAKDSGKPFDMLMAVLDYYYALRAEGVYSESELPKQVVDVHHIYELETNAQFNGLDGYIRNSAWNTETISALKTALSNLNARHTLEIIKKLDEGILALGQSFQDYLDDLNDDAIDELHDTYVDAFFDALDKDDLQTLVDDSILAMPNVEYLPEDAWKRKMEELRELVPNKAERIRQYHLSKAKAQEKYTHMASLACVHLQENYLELGTIWLHNMQDPDSIQLHFKTDKGTRYLKFDDDPEKTIMEVYDDNKGKNKLMTKIIIEDGNAYLHPDFQLNASNEKSKQAGCLGMLCITALILITVIFYSVQR